jgi:hypothetical protein
MADKPPQEAADDACDEPTEKVGPGKPPRHTRFKPGQSGNPNGRPKGSKNFATILQQQLRKMVTITVDGKPKRVTVQEVIARRLANDSMKAPPTIELSSSWLPPNRMKAPPKMPLRKLNCLTRPLADPQTHRH